MNKVEHVNLSGRAYQLEEQAYTALAHYLDGARKKLADDPDKDEVMRDFEQAIAEKCDALLNEHKNVITTVEMNHIIKAMGPVEPDAAEKTKAAMPDNPPKRLYTLKEGSSIGGVCNGLAAYFNIDVTIMRLIFVLLVFATSGAWIIVYFILMFVIPEAKTPEQKAELRGERFTAQDLLDRTRQKYREVGTQEHWKQVARDSKPALSELGAIVMRIMRLLSTTIAVLLGFGIAFMTVALVTCLWIVVNDRIVLQDQLSTISSWAVAGGIVSVYTLFVVPTAGMVLAFFALGREKAKKLSTALSASLGVIWMIALTALICIGLVVGGRVADYQRSHGYIEIDGRNSICINDQYCR